MTGSARRLPWSHVVPVSSTTSDRFSMRRRTLYRALAVALALAAITPLFADLAVNSGRGNPKHQAAQRPGSQVR